MFITKNYLKQSKSEGVDVAVGAVGVHSIFGDVLQDLIVAVVLLVPFSCPRSNLLCVAIGVVVLLEEDVDDDEHS